MRCPALMVTMIMGCTIAAAQEKEFLLTTNDSVAASSGKWSIGTRVLKYDDETNKCVSSPSSSIEMGFTTSKDGLKSLAITMVDRDAEGLIFQQGSYRGHRLPVEDDGKYRGHFIRIANGRILKQGTFLLEDMPLAQTVEQDGQPER